MLLKIARQALEAGERLSIFLRFWGFEADFLIKTTSTSTSSHQGCFMKEGVLIKNFAKFTGKDLRPATLSRRDFNAGLQLC